jgi:predicted enzyme related to lactoylglutathione lyase
MFLGLRTVIYHVDEIEKAKQWYERATGFKPYFDQAYYVGFNVGGFELGLDPDPSNKAQGACGVTAYWGVEDIKSSLARLLEIGATLHTDVQDVGEGILLATVSDPFGNILGIIENPHFSQAARE